MNSTTSSTLRWVLLALLGLTIAVAVGIAAGKLTSQQIGLASEPLAAGKALAPKSSARPGHNNGGGKPGHPHPNRSGHGQSTTTTTVAPLTTTTPTTSTPPTSTVPPTTTNPGDDSTSPTDGGGHNDD